MDATDESDAGARFRHIPDFDSIQDRLRCFTGISILVVLVINRDVGSAITVQSGDLRS